MLSCVETWHAGLSLPAQTLLPNLKIKCLQWQQKRVQRVCPKHAKSKERCLHFKVHAHVNTYNIQTTVCGQWFDRKMDNFEGDTKPVLIILTEKKGLFKSLSSFHSAAFSSWPCNVIYRAAEWNTPRPDKRGRQSP